MKLVPRRKNGNDLIFRNDFDEVFNRFFNDWPFAQMERADQKDRFVPQVQITENDKAYKITAELPGLEEKDFEVFVEDNVLTLKGEKKEETKEEGENFHTYETRFGSFQRSFRLPENVDDESIEAKFKNGVLKLEIKKDTAKARRKQIAVN